MKFGRIFMEGKFFSPAKLLQYVYCESATFFVFFTILSSHLVPFPSKDKSFYVFYNLNINLILDNFFKS